MKNAGKEVKLFCASLLRVNFRENQGISTTFQMRAEIPPEFVLPSNKHFRKQSHGFSLALTRRPAIANT
jgi:hypothetical protein